MSDDILPGDLDWEHAEVRPPVPLSKAAILLQDGRFETDAQGHLVGGRALRHCQDPIHLFADVPGRCQCGELYSGGVFPEEAT